MPSSREIENQNNLLLDQRDIMEEIADLFEEAAVSGEMMVDSLTEAKDLTINNSFISLLCSKKEVMQRTPSIKNRPSFILPFLVFRDWICFFLF